jgi:Rod binding domain-containing protein
MLVDAYASAAARAGAGLGLADLVLREMHRMRATATTPNTGDPTP